MKRSSTPRSYKEAMLARRNKSVSINLIPSVEKLVIIPDVDMTEIISNIFTDDVVIEESHSSIKLSRTNSTDDMSDTNDAASDTTVESDSVCSSSATTPTRRTSPRRRVSGVAVINVVDQIYQDPRLIIRERIKDICEDRVSFLSLSDEDRETLVRRIERSCYTKVFDSCNVEFINKRWTDKIFVERYSAECYRIMANLSMPDNDLIDKLISREVAVEDIANCKSQELNPRASQNDRDLLNQRLNQRIDIKFSDKYKCIKCGAHKTRYYEFQMRALDEASSNMMECVECGHKWIK